MDRRRKELAEFLRSRRERLTPTAAGLPSGQRRRTPGLRREEVAELAGIGTGWYTFLEQGRDVRPSEGALRRIARALRLDQTERSYLLNLALDCVPKTHGEDVVPPLLLHVIHAFRRPAIVGNQRWDLLDYNEPANALFDFDYMAHRERNRLRQMFTPEARALYPNWEYTARQFVSAFRTQNASLLGDPWVMSVVEELKHTSPQFRAWWADQAVSESSSGHLTLDHPLVGRLTFDFAMLEAVDSPNLKLQVFSWDGEDTRRRHEELIRQLQDGEHSSSHNLWTALRVPGSCESAERLAVRPSDRGTS